MVPGWGLGVIVHKLYLGGAKQDRLHGGERRRRISWWAGPDQNDDDGDDDDDSDQDYEDDHDNDNDSDDDDDDET